MNKVTCIHEYINIVTSTFPLTTKMANTNDVKTIYHTFENGMIGGSSSIAQKVVLLVFSRPIFQGLITNGVENKKQPGIHDPVHKNSTWIM